ncbi:TTL domain-containing protein [Pleurostoma richardsiae]|uniref:TTL domain-containing protein n=1 Tax=Pleurostoma richardsiae TaxID=41990 RepID=A0AA38R9F9_9PEZI|nr:TTL domain-containing protein [Pleurostoma richardsiae]
MHAYVKSSEPWLDEHIRSYIRRYAPGAVFIDKVEEMPAGTTAIFQICDGVDMNRHFDLLNHSTIGLINAYPNSDALARKDHLARVVEYWTVKRPESILKKHVPTTVRLNLDYSEYVDDALTEADDLALYDSLQENEKIDAPEREWWILKPALCDSGAGIRIFSTVDELASKLELVACVDDDDAVAGELDGTLEKPSTDASPDTLNFTCEDDGRIPSSQMRDFVAQQYITPVSVLERRKWHVRVYVLAIGRLKVYVFREMLALLASDVYEPPWESPSLRSSLTNTALQKEDEYADKKSMRDFWALPDGLFPGDWKSRVFDQICDVSAELFRATAHTMPEKFVLIDKCFGLFALDFLVDSSGVPWLLEANETPSFYEHGVGGALAQRLLESVIYVAMDHMGLAQREDAENASARDQMLKILDETERLGKSNIRDILPED